MKPINLYNVGHFLGNLLSKELTNMNNKTPWGPIGYPVFKRTYARYLDEDRTQSEEFEDAIKRVIAGCNDQLQCGFDEDEQAELFDILVKLKGSVAGRFWWQLGTETVNELGLLSLQNCAFTLVNEPIRPFTWTFDALMLGCGVGFNIQREFVYRINELQKNPVKVTRLDTNDADFIVPDSREGWVKLLEKTLEAYFFTGESFTYSTKCLRPYGAPIRGFGGTASGPEPLAKGITQISGILDKRLGKQLRPIDCLDVMNIIGSVVVAGNVRRTAMIALGDMDDSQYLDAKRWDLGNIPNWRAMSNNSVVCNNIEHLPEKFWQGYYGNGEPYGLINLGLSRKVGRLGETQYPDPMVQGYNPCAEQSLADKETCCLAEVFLPNIESSEEFKKVLYYLYVINKHSLALSCHHSETEQIVNSNMRMGIGLTGLAQCEQHKLDWLPLGYEYLRDLDKEYSEHMMWPESVKLTTVKPSGTLSLLPGVTPGAHPGFSEYHIRRVRMTAGCDLERTAREHGHPVEYVRNFDGTEDHNTVVVEFPCRFPTHTKFAKNMSAVNQLEFVKYLQMMWSDNSVSCTIYYKKEEIPEIKQWLKDNYDEGVKSVSFLLHSDHGFDQAPLEEITREEYEERVKNCKPIVKIDVTEDEVEVDECAGGACPVK